MEKLRIVYPSNIARQLSIATAALAVTQAVRAEPWDDTAKGFKDAMYGDIATYGSIILVGATVVLAGMKKVGWGAVPGAGLIVALYWMAPAIVTWAKKLAGS